MSGSPPKRQRLLLVSELENNGRIDSGNHSPDHRNNGTLSSGGEHIPARHVCPELQETDSSQANHEEMDWSSPSPQNYHRGLNDLRTQSQVRPTQEQHDQASLFARLRRVVSERTDSIKQEENLEDGQRHHAHIPFTDQAPSVHCRVVSDLRLPSRELSDHLVATYLSREYVNMPIFDLLDFRSAYEYLCNRESVDEETALFYGMLNVIFGLACLIIGNVDDSDASTFYSRGQKFISSSEDQRGSLAHVQAYILQSQYFNAIDNLQRAWATIGLAIRTAQSLGLHLNSGSQGMVDRKDRELTRKLWHGCVIMERMTALQMGISPQTLDPFRVPLPTPLDNEYVDTIFGGQQSTETERPSIIEFFTSCARLYDCIGDILSVEDEFRLRNCSAGKKLLSLDLQQFLKIDCLLHSWHIALPSFLRLDAANGPQADPIAARQRNILQIRYLYIRLRLYRPLFILAIALSIDKSNEPETLTDQHLFSADTPLVLTLARNCAAKCLSAAMRLVQILSQVENALHADEDEDGTNDPHADFCPSAWESIDYLYVCGTVLIAAYICPALFHNGPNPATTIRDHQIKESWRQTMLLMEQYHTSTRQPETTRAKAGLCLNALRALSSSAATDTGAMSHPTGIALDSGTRQRLRQRTESETGETERRKARRRSRAAAGAQASSLPDDGREPQKKFIDLSWLESLPVDVCG
ncbi:hypothetical protein VTN00DRAFT_9738 [Thermoascus crustaceus]|uniref:uncharacterized protein n=1 Tax=Thermoascus crustaceus TaxID=5088 RepID=UPI003742D59E